MKFMFIGNCVYLKIASAFLLSAAVFSSCTKEPANNNEDNRVFDVSDLTVDFKSTGGMYYVNVRAENVGSWSAVSPESWIRISGGNGGYDTYFIVEISENPGEDIRRGTIVVSAENAPADSRTYTIIVKQDKRTVVPVFKVDETPLNFSGEGGTLQFQVTAQNVGRWSASSRDTWFELRNSSGTESAAVEVIVSTNETANGKSGTITITADGDPREAEYTIAVSQEGLGLVEKDSPYIFEKSSLYRMGVNGFVLKSSLFRSEIWNETIYDAEFDIMGMLDKYKTRQNDTEYYITVTYDPDVRARIISIEGTSGSESFSMNFEYGNHGTYISTFSLARDFDRVGYPVAPHVLLPSFLRDLTRVTVASQAFGNMSAVFTGFSGEGNMVVSGPFAPEMRRVEYDGGYMTSVTYLRDHVEDSYMKLTFDIDPTYGRYIQISGECTDVEELPYINYSFIQNQINAISSFINTDLKDSRYGMYSMEYDSRFLPTRINNAGNDLFRTFDYTYDGSSNWTTMRVTEENKTVSHYTTEYIYR